MVSLVNYKLVLIIIIFIIIDRRILKIWKQLTVENVNRTNKLRLAEKKTYQTNREVMIGQIGSNEKGQMCSLPTVSVPLENIPVLCNVPGERQLHSDITILLQNECVHNKYFERC